MIGGYFLNHLKVCLKKRQAGRMAREEENDGMEMENMGGNRNGRGEREGGEGGEE